MCCNIHTHRFVNDFDGISNICHFLDICLECVIHFWHAIFINICLPLLSQILNQCVIVCHFIKIAVCVFVQVLVNILIERHDFCKRNVILRLAVKIYLIQQQAIFSNWHELCHNIVPVRRASHILQILFVPYSHTIITPNFSHDTEPVIVTHKVSAPTL